MKIKSIAALLMCGAIALFAAGCSETKADESEPSQAVQSSDENVSHALSDDKAEDVEKTSSAVSAQDENSTASSAEKPDDESVKKFAGTWSIVTDDYVLMMALGEDGTVILSRDGVTQEGTWKADGDKLTVHNSGEDTVFIYKDKRLYYETNDTVYFSKGLSVDEGSEEQIQTYSFADQKYEGLWVLLYENSIDEDASEITASSLYVDLYKGGVALGVSSGKELNGTWSSEGDNVSIILEGNEELFTYKDGALVSKNGNHRMIREG